MQVTLIDEEKNPGGVCLYRGCIPSKALLHVAKVVDEAAHASKWGVTFGEPAIDVDKLRAYKQGVVDKLTAGVGSVAKLRKVNYVQGRATLTGPKSLKVTGGVRRHRHPVRAPDSRHRLASDEDSVARARQPADDGLDVGRSSCPTCRSRCWWSAAATSASSSAPSTRRSAARCRWSR